MMHFCLIELETIIKDSKTLKCRRLDDSALEITDQAIGNIIIIAEWVPPYAIQLTVKIAPSLSQVNETVRCEIYEYLLCLATKHALSLLQAPDDKSCAIGTKFHFVASERTKMANLLEECMDELRAFIDRNLDNIREFLRCRNVLP